MNQETITQLKEVFVPVAEKIGQSAEFGWEVVVRQQFLYGLVAIFFVLLGIVVAYLSYDLFKWAAKTDSADKYIAGDCRVVSVIGFIVSIIMIIWGSIAAILYLGNPYYYAIQFFMNLVK